MSATTLDGLRVRAQILTEISDYTDDEEDEEAAADKLMIRATVRDLSRM